VKRAAIALLLLAGCSRAITPPVKVTARQDLGVVHVLAVMPAVPAPAMIGEASAPDAVTRLLYAAVQHQPVWSVVDAAKARLALDKIPAASPEARAGTLAARVNADGALTATISTYRERVGSAYGVSEPASVSLQMLFVRARQQDAAWKAEYSITQEPLAYNLWNFWGVLRAGPKWMTAEELAKIGIDEAVERLAAATGAAR